MAATIKQFIKEKYCIYLSVYRILFLLLKCQKYSDMSI